MVAVSEEGRVLLGLFGAEARKLRNLRADFEVRMREAFEKEAEQAKEDAAQTLARALEAGVPKTQIAKEAGYKNYYVSLKDLDSRAQKYRGLTYTAPVQEEEAAITWVIVDENDWTDPNQYGEETRTVELLLNGYYGASVELMRYENEVSVTFVDLVENPDVSVRDVKALKNEIVGALDA